jgi:hypothetical protein
MRGRSHGVRMQGAQYCRSECLELALEEVLGRSRASVPPAAVVSHRIPLGLLLLSRQQLTAQQLRVALEAQRREGSGAGGKQGKNESQKKLGAWLQKLGFSTESEITAALARQWSCPVLRATPMAIAAGLFPAIPNLLLESFQMMPVGLVESTGTLLMAFSQGIDYTMLYAIERMLGYRTEACLVCPSTLQENLHSIARRDRARDVIFDCAQDPAECARIIGNYSTKVKAEEVRIALCGEHFWIRLERLRQEAVTLVLRASASPQFPVLSSQ